MPASCGGSRHRCPACRGGLVVPAGDQPGVAAEAVDPGPAPGGHAAADGSQSPEDRVRASTHPTAPRRRLRPGVSYVPVVCGRCGTRMYATRQEVGQVVTCPECGTRAVVEPPMREPGGQGGVGSGEPGTAAPGASLRSAASHPRPELRADVTYIPVVCRGCKTRMYATEEEVGQEVTCPDCGTKAVVQRPPVEPRGQGGVGSREPGTAAPGASLRSAASHPRPELRAGVTYIPVVCEIGRASCRERV